MATAAELAKERAAADGGDEDDFGEGDTLAVDLDRVSTLARAARRRLEEIDAALERLHAGTYGLCDACGRPISPDRLEAIPEATQCVGCKGGGAHRCW